MAWALVRLPGRHLVRAGQFDISESPLHFVGDFGFHVGGKWSLKATISWDLSAASTRRVLNRTMAQLLLCDESVVGVSSRTLSVVPQGRREQSGRYQLLTKWQYCTEGNYANTDLCESIPFESVTNNSTNSNFAANGGDIVPLTETISLRDVVVQERSHIYFFVTNCEVWGASVGGTRYPAACKVADVLNRSKSAFEASEGSAPCPNLKPSSTSLDIEEIFVNPNGYLSFTEMPYVPLYTTLTPLWAVLAIAWWINTLVFTARRHVVRLQTKMAFVPLTRLLYVSIAMWHWRLKNGEASEANETNQTVVRFGLHAADVLYRCVFNEVLLLMSKGWQITRPNLHIQEFRNVRALMVMYAASWGVYYLSLEMETMNAGNDEESGIRVAFVGLVVLTTMFLIILYTIWFSVSQQLVVLSYQLNLIRAYNVNPRTTPIWIKFEMMRIFRQAFALYLLLNAMADVMMASHQRSSPWIPVMADEILEFFVVASIGWTFRARDFSPYFARVRRASLRSQEAAAASVAESNENTDPNLDNSRRDWIRGMPLPSAPESMFHPSRSRVVVFFNPDGGAGLGATPVEGRSAPLNPGTLIIKADDNHVEMTRMETGIETANCAPKPENHQNAPALQSNMPGSRPSEEQEDIILTLPMGSPLGFELESGAESSPFDTMENGVHPTFVSSVVDDSPAAEMGLRTNMRLLSVNGTSTGGIGFSNVLRMIHTQSREGPLVFCFQR